MALGSTQPLTEMSTRSIPWGKGGRCVRLTNLPTSCAFVMKSGNLNFLEPSGPVQACNGTGLPISESYFLLFGIECLSLHKDTTPPQPNHTVTPTHIEPEQYTPWNKSTISHKLLKMDVVTPEACWAVNSEIIKPVTSSWSIVIQLHVTVFWIDE
jgi:hypothetical protein